MIVKLMLRIVISVVMLVIILVQGQPLPTNVWISIEINWLHSMLVMLSLSCSSPCVVFCAKLQQ